MELESKAKVKKIKTGEVIAESLDNTASVGKIMTFLDSRRKMIRVYRYVSSLTRQQRQGTKEEIYEHFNVAGQPLNTYNDDWDGGLPSGYFENLSHKSLLPRVITEPCHIGKEDPVTEILQAKRKWYHKTLNSKRTLNRKLSRAKSYRWMDDNVLYCPKYFVDVAAHLETDPDPFFGESYNWYYTGRGNMHTTSINGGDYIIHSELNCLNVSQLFKDTMSIDHKNTVTFKCIENIFETVYQQNYIALRAKHKVIILKISGSEGIKLEKLKEIESELPCTNISFDEYHKNIVYITTLDYMLSIVNLDRMTCRKVKLRGKFLTLTDNWSSVIGSEREYYLHVTGDALTFYDKRTNDPVQRWKSLKYQTDLVVCNRILATKYCQGKPQMYLGTTHHLFLMDMRYSTKTNTKPKAIMRWTHGMRSKMTQIDIGKLDFNKEIICLASHWAPDMCFLSNYSDILTSNNELRSVSMPYRPPDLLDAYNRAQRKGLCCNLYEPVIDRLMMAVTGLSLVQGEDSPRILLQNSLGDISCYSLYPQYRSAYIEDDGVEQLYEWTKKLNWETKPFEATHIFDLSRLWNSLRRIPGSYELGYRPYIKRRHKFNEQDIYDTYENGEVDTAFLEAWQEKDENEEITLHQTETSYRHSEATNMELSDDEF